MGEKGQVDKVLAKSAQKIETLKAGIKEQDALQVGYRLKLDKSAAAQAKAEATLKNATTRRGKERKEFDAADKELAHGVSQFSLAIKTLQRKNPKKVAAALLENG